MYVLIDYSDRAAIGPFNLFFDAEEYRADYLGEQGNWEVWEVLPA